MASHNTKIPFIWTSIPCDDSTLIFNPVTAWMPCGDWDEARVVFEVAGETDAAWRGTAVLQFADYPDEGSKPQTTVSAIVNGNGMKYPTQWYAISANSDANQIMRLAIEANRASGSGYCSARVSGVLELKKA